MSVEVQQTLNTTPLLFRFAPAIEIPDDALFELCRINRDYRIERTAQGALSIMAPTGAETSWRNVQLTVGLAAWAENEGSGVVFDSSTGFSLPNGAMRSPDSSWVKRSRLTELTPANKQKFLPLCPDFVIELRSPTDSMTTLREKMVEYLANGTVLGWLFDPVHRTVEIFRPEHALECLTEPDRLSAEPELPGFFFDPKRIWNPDF